MDKLLILKTTIPKSGSKEDYINTPIVKDGVPFGFIHEVEEVKDNFELSIVVWKRFMTFDYEDFGQGRLASITIS